MLTLLGGGGILAPLTFLNKLKGYTPRYIRDTVLSLD